MPSFDAYLGSVLDSVAPLPPSELALPEAAGTVLAETVTASESLPPFENSAMDGYAVRAADVAAVPVTLSVIGDIAAGDDSSLVVRSGVCARIMTGAPMPPGADSVVPVEWTDGGTTEVTISKSAPPGNYIRRVGEDVTAGQVVMSAGTFLGAPQIGLLAGVGRAKVVVRPRPRVVVMSTGSELVEPGTPLRPGQIWDSNSFTLTTAAFEAGAIGYRCTPAGDDADAVLAAIQGRLDRADVVITSGGVSMGAYDVVKEVLTGMGTMRFEKVDMRPGRPQGFGMIDDRTLIFTLPGNPVSAYVSFLAFVVPALRKMQGLSPGSLPTSPAVLTDAASSPPGLRHFLRGVLSYRDGSVYVTPVRGQGSHQMAALAGANALIVLSEDVTEVASGSTVPVVRLRDEL